MAKKKSLRSRIKRWFKFLRRRPVQHIKSPKLQSPKLGITKLEIPKLEYPKLELSLSSPSPSAKTPKTECTFTVPPELVLHILEYLPIESKVALSLTCRSLYVQFCPPNPTRRVLGDSAATQLLLWLEKDVPSVFFCQPCLKLHKWDRRGDQNPSTTNTSTSAQVQQRIALRDPGCCPRGGSHYQIGRGLDWDEHGTLHPSTARAMMNRHLYGAGHGPDASAYDFVEVKELDRPHKLRRRISRKARIVDGELLVQNTTTLVYSDAVVKAYERQEENSMPCVLYWSPRMCRHYGDVLDTFYRNASEKDEEFLARHSMFDADWPSRARSCDCCHTDSVLEVRGSSVVDSNNGQKKMWTVTFRTWRQLGRCRSPDDVKWKQVQHMWSRNYDHTHRSVLKTRAEMCYGTAGTVRRRWEGGGAMSSRECGRFVNAGVWKGTGVFWHGGVDDANESSGVNWERMQRWGL